MEGSVPRFDAPQTDTSTHACKTLKCGAPVVGVGFPICVGTVGTEITEVRDSIFFTLIYETFQSDRC